MASSVTREIEIGADVAAPIRRVRVAIVGAGFSGLGLAIRLKQRHLDDFIVLERASAVGGTWRDNTYPGCACDVQSHLYSFSFAPNPTWSRLYSPQPEIQDYLQACVKRFELAPHICYEHELLGAAWDESGRRWLLTTSQGRFSAEFLALGNGPLSEPSLPSIPGLGDFKGTIFHSARWDHTHDLTGERVAIVGTGASAIQFIPRIQPSVGRLTLFQRTPPWILPRLDRPIPPQRRQLFQALPLAQRLARAAIYWQREVSVLGLVYRSPLMKEAQQLARDHLERQVPDLALRRKLTPHYEMGCKRILLSDDFYPAIGQPNAELVTERIREVRAHSVVAGDGRAFPVDTIIAATGFHVTDMPAAQFVYGRGGQRLADAWSNGPSAYLGSVVHGFPNLFLLIGPNTGLGHTSMIFMIESQLTYILDCLQTMERRSLDAFDVRQGVQAAFNGQIRRRTRGTVWVSGCSSWYLDARGHNTTIWPGFTWEYRARTRHFDPADYHLTPQMARVDAGQATGE